MAPDEEIVVKWKKWREDGNEQIEEELLKQYLPLVNYVANRLSVSLPSMVDRDDLISYGRMGLMDALQKFDYKRGLKFETYAMWRIKGAMIDGLRKADWIPRSVRDKSKKIEEAYHNLEQELKRSVTDREVSEYLGMSEEDLHQVIQETAITSSMISLDEPVYDEEDQKSARHSLIVDETADNPEEKIEKSQLKDLLVEVIDRLPEKERTVISLCYYEDLSMTEIAEIMGLSTSRISQLHSKAIYRLRGSLGRMKKYIY
ncbi:MAG: FliA/WhiG family RNA polymerase sigma factor [Bacillaceae bacterium]|nr:FliA/WhiG family RNA polymerase sigma factor [Bacillaceae bacterium]